MEQFKRIQVVMLPTKEKAYTKNQIILHTYGDKKGTIRFAPWTDTTGEMSNIFQGQHLYFLSDDKIEDGDWSYCSYTETVSKYTGFEKEECCKKIIATTDTSLGWSNLGQDEEGRTLGNSILGIGTPFKPLFPQPSQQFIERYIEAYNASKPITEVLVKYELDLKYPSKANNILKLKVNPKDNTITIKKLKDFWNREEYEAGLRKAFNAGMDFIEGGHLGMSDENKWIKENL